MEVEDGGIRVPSLVLGAMVTDLNRKVAWEHAREEPRWRSAPWEGAEWTDNSHLEPGLNTVLDPGRLAWRECPP